MSLDPQAPAASTEAVGTREHSRMVRKAALASTVGTTIEWYDFFLYNTAAALIFPATFFPTSSSYAGQLESFATYAVGFAARPVGAFIFGHWGDRIGRKATLIITLLMMGLATTLVGVLPGADSIGKAAPLLLVLLRLVQGIAVGGDSGASVRSAEPGPRPRVRVRSRDSLQPQSTLCPLPSMTQSRRRTLSRWVRFTSTSCR